VLGSKVVKHRPWTDDELKRARDMLEAGRFYDEIDKMLARPAGATRQRLNLVDRQSGRRVQPPSIRDTLLAERDARDAARNQRTLTQTFVAIMAKRDSNKRPARVLKTEMAAFGRPSFLWSGYFLSNESVARKAFRAIRATSTTG